MRTGRFLATVLISHTKPEADILPSGERRRVSMHDYSMKGPISPVVYDSESAWFSAIPEPLTRQDWEGHVIRGLIVDRPWSRISSAHTAQLHGLAAGSNEFSLFELIRFWIWI
jgi:hypothetical protein